MLEERGDADISNLDEIFNIQSDIAMQVANALQAEFSPEEQSLIEQTYANAVPYFPEMAEEYSEIANEKLA